MQNPLMAQKNNSSVLKITQEILNEEQLDIKLQLNSNLLLKIRDLLSSNKNDIVKLDSNGLVIELIDDDKKIQLLSWALSFNEKWEYFGFLKSYNEIKKEYEVFELIPTDFHTAYEQSGNYDQQNWPSGVYTKLIENEYNNRKYYTLLGWLAPDQQTAYKFVEVVTLSKNGKPYFGKSKYFKKDKEFSNRLLFGYFFQSKFLLNYGKYDYTTKKWNRKKKKYEFMQQSDDLIVFDQLISMYPEMYDRAEFLVPVGNAVNAFIFEKGKWIYISDIDARNLKQKVRKTNSPDLDLFDK